ncbi:MAG: hypothetical protein AUH78_27200 [Gemmatimonadetes bacterium 13_1_40CM_4_69_8]|nr:MAG: hypothetical protein AUH78_27200 [Gemmatimonadetes bacterium 13_1_40CM_4_69_8]
MIGVADGGGVLTDHEKDGVIDANTAPVGVSGVIAVGNTALAATSGRPQPRRLSGAARFAA